MTAMTWNVQNLLYRRPELYEKVYPEPNEETPAMCRRMFERFLGRTPESILDIGCGTGRDLAALSRGRPTCIGVDYLDEMVTFARSRFPHLDVRQGDMRHVRLGRKFEAILCMGSAIMYALSDADVDATLETFAAHAAPGTLLILDLNNAASFLDGVFARNLEGVVKEPYFQATYKVENRIDRRRQMMSRKRTWYIPGQEAVIDSCEYRLFFPAELPYLLGRRGFSVLGMYDNQDLVETELSGLRLYVAARYGAAE